MRHFTTQSQIHHVYLIVNTQSNLCKIGLTNDVAARWRQIQKGHRGRVIVCFSMEVADRHAAFELETRLHRHFTGQRISGEWFKIDPLKVLGYVYVTETLRSLVLRVVEYPKWIVMDETPDPVDSAQKAYDQRMLIYMLLFIVAGYVSSYMAYGYSIGAVHISLVEAIMYMVMCLACICGLISFLVGMLRFGPDAP